MLLLLVVAGCGAETDETPAPDAALDAAPDANLDPVEPIDQVVDDASRDGDGPAVDGDVDLAPEVEPDAPHDASADGDAPLHNVHLFYLHGAFVETFGPGAYSAMYGVNYEYDEIVAAFEAAGFALHSEARPAGTVASEYADTVVGQVDELLADGVPAERIALMGHSKGGAIARQAAERLDASGFSLVLLAGCLGSSDALAASGTAIDARIFSVLDADDTVASSCEPLIEASPSAVTDELVLELDRGHGLFFTPEGEWIDPVVTFLESE